MLLIFTVYLSVVPSLCLYRYKIYCKLNQEHSVQLHLNYIFYVIKFVLQTADLVHVIYGHGTHTHHDNVFMAVDIDFVYLVNLF